MKIIIEISDHYAQVLGKWASVSRTLDSAESACDNLVELLVDKEDEDSKRIYERANWCGLEIKAIRPAIEALHYTAKQEIWIQQNNT